MTQVPDKEVGVTDAALDDVFVDVLAEEQELFDADREGFDLFQSACALPRVAGRAPRTVEVEQAVDRWADRVLTRTDALRDGASPWRAPLRALLETMFTQGEGCAGLFGGGVADDGPPYDDPRHSFLDDVVSDKRGLPIALSLLVMEVARRCGLVSCGLAFPRQFMTGVLVQRTPLPPGAPEQSAEQDIATSTRGELFIIDAFAGDVVTLEKIAERIGMPTAELREYLVPASPDTVLVRMLINLRSSYVRRKDPLALGRTLSRLLILRPRDAGLLLERAEVRLLLGDSGGATRDAARARMRARDDDERAAATALLERIADRPTFVH